MQPIPLPPIVETDNGLSSASLTAFWVGIGLLVLAVVAVLLSVKFGLGPLTEIGVCLGIVALLPTFLGGMLYLGPPGANIPSYAELVRQEQDHDQLVQKTVEKEYGLKLTESQARVLDYPTKAPKSDFKVYGSFKDQKQTDGTDFGFESRTVYLVWSKDKLGLSESTDGESFTPIAPKQEAK